MASTAFMLCVCWRLFLLLGLEKIMLADHGCTLQYRHEDILFSCSGLRLTSVPTFIPDDVTWLNLSHNALVTLHQAEFSHFRRLRVLDLSFNNIWNISADAFFGLDNLQHLNLSFNSIGSLSCQNLKTVKAARDRGGFDMKKSNQKITTSVPGAFSFLTDLRSLQLNGNCISKLSSDVFNGLKNLNHLDLSRNNLTEISNDTFFHTPNLTSLNLCHNRLEKLESRALDGLSKLRELWLSHNSLTYAESSLPAEVFQPVGRSLTSLNMKSVKQDLHCEECSYPESAFSQLTALQVLQIDALAYVPFGKGFQSLRSLTTLDLSETEDGGSCVLTSLTNTTFDNLANSSLQVLLMETCMSLYHLEACAFCSLSHLKEISIVWSRVTGVKPTLRSLYAFQGRNMTRVTFQGVSREFQLGFVGTVLDRDVTKFLMNVCVSELDLGGNDISLVKRHALTKPGSLFNACIQHLDLSENLIQGMNWFEMARFGIMSVNLVSVQFQEQRTLSLENAMYILQIRKHEPINSFPAETIEITPPPKLKFLNISACCRDTNQLPRNLVFGNNTLETVDLSYADIRGCVTRSLGLNHLKNINISGASCRTLSTSVLEHLESLEVATLQKMSFNPKFIMDHGWRLFRRNVRLKRLDLSHNDLELLPFDLLYGQRDLRELLLIGNGHKHVPVDISHHGNLTFLDLADNAISYLMENETDLLDHLAASPDGHFRLNLHGNPLLCNCKVLPFLRWMRDTRVRMDYDGDYACGSESGQLDSTKVVIKDLDLLWRRCIGEKMFLGSMTGLVLLLSSIGAALAVCKNATRLRFLLNVFRHINIPQRQHKVKDVYVAYCEDDTEMVCTLLKGALEDIRGVRLFIRHMTTNEAGDFYLVPGDNQAEKMLEHIEMCYRVLLVLTPAIQLDRDDMAGFIMRAALHSIRDTMPERVLLLCVGVRHLPALASLRALLETVPERHVFFLPAQAGQDHPVWDHVAAAILE